ncbi:MAG: extensin family protein, partial [Paracoccaceae bacterium]
RPAGQTPAPAIDAARVEAVARQALDDLLPGAPDGDPKRQDVDAVQEFSLAAAVPRDLPLSLRPEPRSQEMERRAMAQRRALERGAVCGDPALQGEPIGRVPGRQSGCGIADGIELRAVSGVALSQPARLDCATASALKRWVEGSLKPAIGSRGGGVDKMVIFASYACRTRNNQRGARLSEHAKGRAIDIGGFRLRDGSTITVLEGWGRGRDGRALRRMHRAACGTFGTVLGPEADRFHRNHFHFDTARHRNGAYCR